MTPAKKRGFMGALGNLAAGGLDGFGAENAAEFAKAIATDGNDESGGQRVEKIDVTLIDPSPDQTRAVDWEWVETLANSILESGLNTPINVRPHPQSPGRYLLIAGEHRWRAHVKANLPTVDALVNVTADGAKSASITLIENLLRKDLTPLETAKGLRRLMDEHGYSYADAAKQLGKSKTWVSNHITMLNLPDPVLDAIQSGAIRDYTVIANIGKAYLSHPDQVLAVLTEATSEAPMTRADLQRIEASNQPAVVQPVSDQGGSEKPLPSPVVPGDDGQPPSGNPGIGQQSARGASPEAGDNTQPPAGGVTKAAPKNPPASQDGAPARKEPMRTQALSPATVVVGLVGQDGELGILDLASEVDAGLAVVSLTAGGSAIHPLSDLRMLGLRR